MNVTGSGNAAVGDDVDSGGLAFAYQPNRANPAELRILNSIVGFEGTGILQQKGSEYNIKTLGIKKTDLR